MFSLVFSLPLQCVSTSCMGSICRIFSYFTSPCHGQQLYLHRHTQGHSSLLVSGPPSTRHTPCALLYILDSLGGHLMHFFSSPLSLSPFCYRVRLETLSLYPKKVATQAHSECNKYLDAPSRLFPIRTQRIAGLFPNCPPSASSTPASSGHWLVRGERGGRGREIE